MAASWAPEERRQENSGSVTLTQQAEANAVKHRRNAFSLAAPSSGRRGRDIAKFSPFIHQFILITARNAPELNTFKNDQRATKNTKIYMM